jgi:DNA-binding CsgD family transcriptional regulator/PAS domain-containing protein
LLYRQGVRVARHLSDRESSARLRILELEHGAVTTFPEQVPGGRKMLSHGRLSELIGSIYDCALDPSLWEPTLATVAGIFQCSVASLTLNDLRHGSFLINKAAGWDPDLLERKSRKHVAEINARLTEWLVAQPTLDEPFVTSLHLTPDYIQRSEYVEECLRPQGIVDVMHLLLAYTPRQLAELGLGRHERQGIVTEREIELARLFIPHLRRAVTISNVLDVRTIERARMAEALDALRCAVVLTNERGSILHANRAAERLLDEGGLIKAGRGVLEAKVSSAQRELRAAIAEATRDVAGFGRTGLAIRLTRPDEPPTFAHILPMTTGELCARLQPGAVAAVFIGAPDENGAQLLAATFSLTYAETRVLESLLTGRTLAETSTHLGIAPSTAKTHLNNIFGKTGVSRQTELIRLASQLIPPVKASEHR